MVWKKDIERKKIKKSRKKIWSFYFLLYLCARRKNAQMKKNKLTALDITRLHNAEFAQFLNRFFEDFEKSGILSETDIDLKAKLDSLRLMLPEFQKSLSYIRSTEESRQLALLDKERGHDMRALRDALRAFKNTRDEEERKAYQALSTIIDAYKGVENANYEEQTLRVVNLIKTLNEAANVKHISQLNLTIFVSRLQESNNAFNTLFANRSYAMSQKTTVNTRELRIKMTTEYKMISQYVLALSNMRSGNYYTSILVLINNGRGYFADILARRDATSKRTEAEPEETPTTAS